jgi:hypothetical protein
MRIRNIGRIRKIVVLVDSKLARSLIAITNLFFGTRKHAGSWISDRSEPARPGRDDESS